MARRRLHVIVAGEVLPSFNSETAGRGGYHRAMNPIQLVPGAVPLAAWREIYRGLEIVLNPPAYTAIDASARAVSTILAKGEPVYGINTGFGKLATAASRPPVQRLDQQVLDGIMQWLNRK